MANRSSQRNYRQNAADKKSGADQYKSRDALRLEAVRQKQVGASSARGAVGKLRSQAADSQKAIRFGASQATAAGMGSGMGSGGGAMVAAGQVGREAQMAGIGQASQDTERIIAAEQVASQKSVEAQEYAAQQGDRDSDYSAAIAEGTTEAEQAIQDSQGFWDDDEAGAMRKIRAMIARVRVMSPEAANALEDKYLRSGGAGSERIHSSWD
tara:strand:+ start:19660 stop:20292 length:633 start_codon:yes stop_codon:yes gene_type:complete